MTTAQIIGLAILVVGAIFFAGSFALRKGRPEPVAPALTRLSLVGAILALVGALVMWIL